MNYDYFEQVWNFNANVTHAPMPYENDPVKYKKTVDITGTGLPNQAEGFAYGGITIEMNPGAMLAGSYVIPQEFTHTLQLHTGGFQGNPLVGWIWETHANWNASQFLPSIPCALDVYNDHLLYELSSSRDNDGSWPFLQLIAEHPRFTPSFNFDIWTQCLRGSDGNATETPLQTICRLEAKTGKFQGDGIAGFGDIIGEKAAHYANFDYQDEQSHTSLIASSHNYNNDAPRDRAILLPVPDRPHWYHPIYTQTARQWGFNIIDLKPKPGAVSVSATLEGIADGSEGADWREALVVQGADGLCRYSPMLRYGTVSIALQPGDRTLSLAVTGAPDIFKPQPFQAGFNVRAHNVYEVSFTGCMPWSMADYAKKRPPATVSSAPNGGGFVAATAPVDPLPERYRG